jgi:hypothetical protein
MRLRLITMAGAAIAMITLSSLGCALWAPILLTMDMMGVGDKANIKYHFPKDAKRVAVVVHLSRNHQIDVGHFDRDVNNLLSLKIAGYTGKKPEIILAGKVHKWMDEHQEWKSPYDVGRGLNADHVVYVDIRRVSFYEKEGWKQFYKGTVEATVAVHRLGSEQDEALPIWGPNSCTFKFPSGVEPLDGSMPQSQFRELFVRHTAERLSWLFVPHASMDEYSDDKGN